MKMSEYRKQRLWGQAAAWAAAFLVLPMVAQAAEAKPPAQAQSQEDSLKALEARAKRLAQQGLPQKTADQRQKESKPIIPEDCAIEVATWHPADPQKHTETVVYEIRGGVVTARLPTIKEPELRGETFRGEGYEITRTFEGRLQGNVIEGTWTYEESEHQKWGWANDDPKITSHDILKTVTWIKLRMELHRDGTVTADTSGESIFTINRVIGVSQGVETKRKSWPDANTPAEWRQPGQGVWQFRSGSSAVVGEPKPAEPTPPAQKPKPSEPRIDTNDPPTKFRLPPEKPAPAKPAPTPQGRRSPTDEYEVDDLPPEARRLFDALPPERKNLFNKYHSRYGLGWKRSGKLLHWLADPKLPTEELEVRGRLLLIADERYQELYKTVLTTVVDNAAENALWKVAAKGLGIPAIKYAELCKDLITMPGEFKKLAVSYEKASDADRVLEKYVASYGKSEADIQREIRITEEATNMWKRLYQRAQAEFQKAKAEAPKAGEPLASDPELRQRQREASQKMLQADKTMRKIAREIHDLQLDSQALDLRLKTINGQWKSWSGKLEK